MSLSLFYTILTAISCEDWIFTSLFSQRECKFDEWDSFLVESVTYFKLCVISLNCL